MPRKLWMATRVTARLLSSCALADSFRSRAVLPKLSGMFSSALRAASVVLLPDFLAEALARVGGASELVGVARLDPDEWSGPRSSRAAATADHGLSGLASCAMTPNGVCVGGSSPGGEYRSDSRRATHQASQSLWTLEVHRSRASCAPTVSATRLRDRSRSVRFSSNVAIVTSPSDDDGTTDPSSRNFRCCRGSSLNGSTSNRFSAASCVGDASRGARVPCTGNLPPLNLLHLAHAG